MSTGQARLRVQWNPWILTREDDAGEWHRAHNQCQSTSELYNYPRGTQAHRNRTKGTLAELALTLHRTERNARVLKYDWLIGSESRVRRTTLTMEDGWMDAREE